MIDDVELLRNYLLTQSTLTAPTLVGNRFWGGMNVPPKDEYKPADGAGVVFKAAGGGLEASDTVLRTRWQFKIYGVDRYIRRDAYLALADCLHNTRGRGGILSSSVETTATPLTEPDSKWQFLLFYVETRIKSRLPVPV